MLSLRTLTTSVPRVSFRRTRTGCASLVISAAILLASSGTTMAWSPSTFGSSAEQLLFSLTNRDRAAAGLPALVNDPYLHKEAEWRAKDMGDRNYFDHHIPPSGKMVFDYMQQDGYCFNIAGENIGLSGDDDSTATANIELAFMASKPHRENILGTWNNLGVGAYKVPGGDKFYAVLFSIPCSPITPKPTHRPTPRPTHKPTPTPTPSRTLAPTSTPTAAPTETAETTPTPEASPILTATPTPSAAPTPTATPTASPSVPRATSSAAPVDTTNQAGDGSTPVSGDATSLRVHEQPVSQGPIDSLFHSLFGGLFSW